MTHLSRKQDDLSAMMSLVRDEVGEKMHDIQGQVQPRHPRRWDSASLTDTKLKQLENPVTASLECGQQLSPRYCVSVDPLRYTDPVSSPQHLDPHAAAIVKVAGDHSHGSPGH